MRRAPRNYQPTRSVKTTTKLSPEAYRWLSKAQWLAHLSISRILFNIVEFAKVNEHEFKKFIEEHEKTY